MNSSQKDPMEQRDADRRSFVEMMVVAVVIASFIYMRFNEIQQKRINTALRQDLNNLSIAHREFVDKQEALNKSQNLLNEDRKDFETTTIQSLEDLEKAANKSIKLPLPTTSANIYLPADLTASSRSLPKEPEAQNGPPPAI